MIACPLPLATENVWSRLSGVGAGGAVIVTDGVLINSTSKEAAAKANGVHPICAASKAQRRSRACSKVIVRTSFALVRTILPRPRDHLAGNANRELAPGVDVAAIVDTGPDTRFGRLLTKRGERLGIAWEQITKHARDRD